MKKRKEDKMNRVMRDILSSLSSEDVYAFGMFLRYLIASIAKEVAKNNYIKLAEKDNVSEASLQEGIANIQSTSVNDCLKVANDVLKNTNVTAYFRLVLLFLKNSNNNCNDEFKNEYRKYYIGGYNKFIGVADKLCTKLECYGLSLLDFQTYYQNLIKENMKTDDVNNPYDIQLISENILGEVRKYAEGKHDVKIIKLIDEVISNGKPYAVMEDGNKRYVQEYPIYFIGKSRLIRYYLPDELPKELMNVVRKGKLEPMISVSSLEIKKINPKQDDVALNDESKHERSVAEILANPYAICVVSCEQLPRKGLPQVYTTETDVEGRVYLVPCEYPLCTVGNMKKYFCLVNDVPTKQLFRVRVTTLNVASLEPKSDKRNKTKIHKN